MVNFVMCISLQLKKIRKNKTLRLLSHSDQKKKTEIPAKAGYMEAAQFLSTYCVPGTLLGSLGSTVLFNLANNTMS